MAYQFERDYGRWPEQITPFLGGTIRDKAGTAIPQSALTTVRLWVYDVKTRQMVPGYSGVDIKSSVGPTGGSAGVLNHPVAPSGIVLQRGGGEEEKHITVRWTYNGGASEGMYRWKVTVVRDPVL